MSGVNGITNSAVHTVVNQPVLRQVAEDSAARTRPADKLELSGVGHLLQSLRNSADVRTDKVAAVKAQIDAGTYESDEKLNVAVDRMLDDLAL